jgi:nucleoid-associated protein YgaU
VLLLVLFLALVALAMLVIESLEAPPREEAVGAAGEDVLVLRLGREPRPGEEPPGQTAAPPPAPGQAAPTVSPPPAPVEDPADYYVVQPGDTLSKIAQEQLGSALMADELARINRLTDPDKLRVGQVLYLR